MSTLRSLDVATTLNSGQITVALTILAIYAAVKANHLYLPIPTFPNVLAIVLPILSFLVFTYNSSSTSKGFIVRFLPRSAGLVVLAIFDAILATVASTILQPQLLECSVDSRWAALFTSKNVRAIKSIQEAFNCCGLHSTVDRAWPFPDINRGGRACIELYRDRRQSCEQPWQQQEGKVLGIWLGIGLSGLFIKVRCLTRGSNTLRISRLFSSSFSAANQMR